MPQISFCSIGVSLVAELVVGEDVPLSPINGDVARMIWRAERALPKTEFRRRVQNLGGQAR